MNRTLSTLFLLSLLALLAVQGDGWSLTPKAALAQESTTAQLPEPTLYMPSNVQRAFDNGSRSPDGNPGETYWQNRSEHDMTIDIMPPSRTISATEVITYYNNSPYPLPALVMRLYFNVHQPEAMRAKPILPGFLNDGIVIDEFRVNDEVAEWPGQSAPGSTYALVPLGEPLAPNESIGLTFRWHFELADAETLFGAAGPSAWKEGAINDTTYFLGYFYPRVAVADDVDLGYDQTEFNLAGEWYGDFVDYTFAVNAPRNFVVWATGDLLNPDDVLQPEYAEKLAESMTSDAVIQIATPEEIQDGLVTAQDEILTWQWQADNVRDIAIALSDNYYWDGGSVVVDPETGRRASVQAAYNEEATDFQQMVEFSKSALDFGSTEWPGVPYPYSSTTVIRGGADEEYPMMVNDSSDPEDPAFTRFVAAHEILHSWFPFYMGVDERRYPMLDEGWVTMFEYLINVRDMGPADADELFQFIRATGQGTFLPPSAGRDLPIITPLDAMQNSTSAFGANPYGKPAQAYLSLKDLMGEEAFKTALHEFMDRWNGKHPLPWDMFNTFNDVYDQDLTWFFNAWFFEPNYTDLALESVEEVDGGYDVQIRNVGGWPIPFDVEVIYADGSEESFPQNPAIWQDSDTVTVALESAQAPQTVTLDSGIFVDFVAEDNTWESDASGTETSSTETGSTEIDESEAGLGDPIFPLEGNPGYDVQHYTIDLAVDTDTVALDGSTTIEAVATGDLPSFNLDFLGYEISAVTVDGAEAPFSRSGQELVITPATPIANGDTFTVDVAYAGVAQPYAEPAFVGFSIASGEEYTTGFQKWGDGYISAMSQPDGAMTWYPANNSPLDKATFTFRITVDDPNIVAASGTLQEVIPVDEDTNTYVWEMSYPMATQVSAVTIGEYEREESVAPNGLPLRNYFPVGMDRSMFSALDATGDMVVFLEDMLGPYPYDVYGAIIVPGYLPEGALEAQTLSIFDAYELDEEIVVHELSHQWFGNSLTVAQWTDIWLHEGFAKYIEALWLESTRGVAVYNEAIEAYYEKQLANAALAHVLNEMGMDIEPLVKGQVMAVADPIAANMYWQSYTGGALLLHNLRLEVGDDIFFEIVRTFYQEHENIPATTEEFIATAEELAGRDLESLWDIWLYSNEIPAPEPLPESGQ